MIAGKEEMLVTLSIGISRIVPVSEGHQRTLKTFSRRVLRSAIFLREL